MRNDVVVGKVKNVFYPFEFQGAGAVGKKPHVHSGKTLFDELDIVSGRLRGGQMGRPPPSFQTGSSSSHQPPSASPRGN